MAATNAPRTPTPDAAWVATHRVAGLVVTARATLTAGRTALLAFAAILSERHSLIGDTLAAAMAEAGFTGPEPAKPIALPARLRLPKVNGHDCPATGTEAAA